jgi:hypothetical protein
VLDAVVSKADFARRRGVTRGRVSQWIHDGQIGVEALDGTGPRARIRADVAVGMLRDRLDWFRGGSVADLGGSRGGVADLKFKAAIVRTGTANLQRQLLELRLAKMRGELISRAEVMETMQVLGRAVQRLFKSGAAWSEELYAAGQAGGLGAHSALLRAKLIEFNHTFADMLMAEAEFEPPEKGAPNV